MKERSSSVPGQGLTKEARNIIDDVPCHDDVCLVEPLQYRTASYKNYKISLWNPEALSDPGRQSSLLSINPTLLGQVLQSLVAF